MTREHISHGAQTPVGYWRRLTDEELLRIRFTTSDPERLSDLVFDVPATEDEEPRVELAYDFRGTKRDLIRCAHCRYPNHKAGFVIRQGSKRFLCGIDCGAKIYGANFNALHKDFTYARDRAGYLHRMNNLRKALPAFNDYLRRLRTEPAFDLYSQTRQQFVRAMPRLRGALQIAIDKQDGALVIEDKARDFDAEQRDEDRYEKEIAEWKSETVTERKKLRRMGYEPEKPKKPLWKTVAKLIGSVPQMTLFSVETSPKQYVADIIMQFENLDDPPVSRMSSTSIDHLFAYRGKRDNDRGRDTARISLTAVGGDTSNMGMANMLKQVAILLERIEQQIDRLAEVPTFFQPSVLGPVAEWATARKLAGTYRAGLNSITFTNEEETTHIISLPANYRVPSKVGVQAFRDAINRQQ